MTALLITLGVFLVAVALNALVAGYETGFVSCNSIRIRYLAEEERRPWAARLLRHIESPDRMLTMLLIVNNILTVVATMSITNHFGEVVAMLIVTPTLLIFGEIIPKSVFRTHPNRLTLALLPLIAPVYWVLTPVTLPIATVTRALFRRINGRRAYLSPLMSSLEDVRVLVDESAQQGTIEPEERRMIHSIIDLQSKLAKEEMVPRIDVFALPDTATRAELLAFFAQTGRSRAPIYRDTVDHIVGVAGVHDVLLDTAPDDNSIQRFVRDVLHVPDTINLYDLFEKMKVEQQHIAVVTDEYGGTDGLITLEDILEVIFGEIQDEHDREEKPIHKVGARAFVIDARMALDEAAEFMGIRIEDDEVETVGGWVMHVAGRIPAQGEVIEHDGFHITILDAGVTQVAKVRLEIAQTPAETDRKS